MKYILTIQGESGNIVIRSEDNNGIIKKVDFLISQDELDTSDKSERMFNTVVVRGTINDKTQSDTKELLEWSMKTAKTEAYKNVSLIIKKDEDVIRDYYMKDMFCTKYLEFFDEGSDSSKGEFILEMRQRKGSIETIVVEC